MILYGVLFVLTALLVFALPTPVEYEEGEEPLWQGVVLVIMSIAIPVTIPMALEDGPWVVAAAYAVLSMMAGHGLIRGGRGVSRFPIAFAAVTYAFAGWLLLG